MYDFDNGYTKRNRFLEKSLSIIITIGAMMFISIYIFQFTLPFIASIYININFISKNIQMQLFFILSLITLIIGSISLLIIDKSRWTQVEGKIVYTYITRNVFSFQKLWTLKHTYQFECKGKQYFKTFYDDVIFNSRHEADSYVLKNFTSKNVTLPASVFSFYPKFSSETSRINIAGLIYFYAVFCLSSIFILIGFSIKLISLHIIDIGIQSNVDGNSYYLIFPKSLENINFHLDLATLFIPVIIFIVAIFFLATIIILYSKQKIFFYIPRVNPLTNTTFEINESNLTCPFCNTLNDKDSIYCSNCGQRIN